MTKGEEERGERKEDREKRKEDRVQISPFRFPLSPFIFHLCSFLFPLCPYSFMNYLSIVSPSYVTVFRFCMLISLALAGSGA